MTNRHNGQKLTIRLSTFKNVWGRLPPHFEQTLHVFLFFPFHYLSFWMPKSEKFNIITSQFVWQRTFFCSKKLHFSFSFVVTLCTLQNLPVLSLWALPGIYHPRNQYVMADALVTKADAGRWWCAQHLHLSAVVLAKTPSHSYSLFFQ